MNSKTEFSPHFSFKRKCSRAVLVAVKGIGAVLINGEPHQRSFLRSHALQEFLSINNTNVYNCNIRVVGGGISSQSEVVLKVIAKAFVGLGVLPKVKALEYDSCILSSDGRRVYPKLPEGRSRGQRQKSYR
jgi:ribosomal protein S9